MKWNRTTLEPSFTAGINGGYYSGGLHTQQAHSTTPLEAPHSAGSTHASSGPPQQQSAVSAPPVASAVAPPGIQHAMVSKSVCLLFPFLSVSSFISTLEKSKIFFPSLLFLFLVIH